MGASNSLPFFFYPDIVVTRSQEKSEKLKYLIGIKHKRLNEILTILTNVNKIHAKINCVHFPDAAFLLVS